MNNRIEELAKAAGAYRIMDELRQSHMDGGKSFTPEAFKKFAELLIQDCCNVLVKEGDAWLAFAKNPPQSQEINATSALFAAARLKEDAVFAIQEHFGIEE